MGKFSGRKKTARKRHRVARRLALAEAGTPLAPQYQVDEARERCTREKLHRKLETSKPRHHDRIMKSVGEKVFRELTHAHAKVRPPLAKPAPVTVAAPTLPVEANSQPKAKKKKEAAQPAS